MIDELEVNNRINC